MSPYFIYADCVYMLAETRWGEHGGDLLNTSIILAWKALRVRIDKSVRLRFYLWRQTHSYRVVRVDAE